MPDERLAAQLRAEMIHAAFLGTEVSPEAAGQLIEDLKRPAPPAPPAPVPPVHDGPPKPPTMWQMLNQTEWWWPNGKPPVRIASMDKPWRWNTVRFLERWAAEMQLAGDLLAESPLQWMHRQPLYKALNKGLPQPGSSRGLLLAARAVHWNTCPMRLAHPGKLDTCACIREGGRVTGATNDPAGAA